MNSSHELTWSSVLCAIAIAIIIVVPDLSPRIFLGDSLSYLAATQINWWPNDRSMLYPAIIKTIWMTFSSLSPLFYLQAAAFGITTGIAALIINRGLGVRNAVAIPVILLIAIDPLRLVWPSFIMTETFSILSTSLSIYFLVGYIAKPRVRGIIGVALVGFISYLLRSIDMPIFATALLLTPLAIALIDRHASVPETVGRPLSARRALFHTTVGLCLFVSLYAGYVQIYRATIGQPASLPYQPQLTLLCPMIPLISVSMFPDQAMGQRILARADPWFRDIRARNAECFSPTGLRQLVIAEAGSMAEAERVAAVVNRRILMTNPAEVVAMAFRTIGDYFDFDYMREVMAVDVGIGRSDAAEVSRQLKEFFGISPDNHVYISPTMLYYIGSASLIWIVVLSPIVLFLSTMWLAPRSLVGWLMTAIVTYYVFVPGGLLTVRACARYLQPVSFFFLVALAFLCETYLQRAASSRASARTL
jgi:hypothetical protein